MHGPMYTYIHIYIYKFFSCIVSLLTVKKPMELLTAEQSYATEYNALCLIRQFDRTQKHHRLSLFSEIH